MSRITPAVLLLALLASGSAHAAKQLIIDVEAQNRPRTSRGPKPSAPPPVAAELQLAMSENETARNLSQGVIDKLTTMGYVVAPDVIYGRPLPKKPTRPDPKAPPPPPDPKAVLRFEIVRVSGSCFVTAKAAEFATQDISFFKYETVNDTLPCTDQLERALAEFVKARPPENAPPGPDAGTPEPSEAAALVEKHPKLVLAPTLLQPEEPAPLGPADSAAPTGSAAPADPAAPSAAVAGAPAAAEPGAAPTAPAAAEPAPEKAKKGCGCSSAGEPALLSALLALAALSRRRGSPAP